MAKFGKNNKYKNMQPSDFGILLVNKGDVVHVVDVNTYGHKVGHQVNNEKRNNSPKKFRLHSVMN